MTSRKRQRQGVSAATIVLAVFAVLVVGFIAYTLRHVRSQAAAAEPTVGLARPIPTAATSAEPVSLWVGDSYTSGVGTSDPSAGEACLTASRLGWICNLDAEGGTGFIANGHVNFASFKPLIGRLKKTQSEDAADIVIIDAGRNDGPTGPALTAAIKRYDAAIHHAYPKARLVQIVPYWVGSQLVTDRRIASTIRAEMRHLGGVTIDPVGEGWITPAKTRSLVFRDGRHPNAAGHRYIAQHLVADFRRLGLQRP